MNLEIQRVENKGLIDEERVVLKVLANEQVGAHVVFSTVMTGANQVNIRPSNVYWFPDRDVKEGDVIYLYTKSGKDDSEETGENTTHSFYWKLDKAIWDAPGSVVIVLHTDSLSHLQLA